MRRRGLLISVGAASALALGGAAGLVAFSAGEPRAA